MAFGFIPSAGFLALYFVPLLMTFSYSFAKSSFDSALAGWDNYKYVWKNEYFLLGFGNLLKMGFCFCASAFVLAVFLSWLLFRHGSLNRLAVAILILPLLIPSVCAVSLWNKVFEIDVLTPPHTAFIALYTLFLWKCSGPSAVILYIALLRLPQEVVDAASLDGCGEAHLLISVRLPMIRSEMALALMFLLMYYFRIYKESYLMFGLYPPEEMYLIQHYMNNQYLKMNAQYVSAAAGSFAAICLLLFAMTNALRGKRGARC